MECGRCAGSSVALHVIRDVRSFILILKGAVESGLGQALLLHDAQIYLLIKFTITTEPPIVAAPAMVCQLKCSPSSIIPSRTVITGSK